MNTPSDKTPTCFAVLFEGRSGSTYLVEALNSHPQIRAEKELLAGLKKKINKGMAEAGDQLGCIERLYVPGDHEYDVIGFKTKMKDILDPEGLAAVLRTNDVRILLLQRRNRIKLLVSLMNAMRLNEATGDWNLYKESDRQATINLDPAEFKEWLEGAEEANRELNAYAHELGLPVLELYYEDILTDATSTFARICDFLGVEAQSMEGECKKNTSDDLREVLENFDELKSTFAGTRYESMFDEVIQPAV